MRKHIQHVSLSTYTIVLKNDDVSPSEFILENLVVDEQNNIYNPIVIAAYGKSIVLYTFSKIHQKSFLINPLDIT